MNSPVSFLTNLRQDRLQRSEMFSWNKIINGLKRSRGIIDPFTTFKPSGWKCYKTIGSYVSCAFIEIWSKREVWRARKMRKSCSRRSREQIWLLEYIPHMYKANKSSTFFFYFSLWTLLSIFSYILLACLCRYSIPLKIPLKWYIIRGLKVHRSRFRKIWHFPKAVKG